MPQVQAGPGNPAQPGKVEKSDKGFLSRKETAPCLTLRPEGYYSIIKAKSTLIKEMDLIPICIR